MSPQAALLTTPCAERWGNKYQPSPTTQRVRLKRVSEHSARVRLDAGVIHGTVGRPVSLKNIRRLVCRIHCEDKRRADKRARTHRHRHRYRQLLSESCTHWTWERGTGDGGSPFAEPATLMTASFLCSCRIARAPSRDALACKGVGPWGTHWLHSRSRQALNRGKRPAAWP